MGDRAFRHSSKDVASLHSYGVPSTSMNVASNLPPEISRIRMEATHLCAKVKVLPDHIFKNPSPYPVVVQTALVESFYVSVRTLLEFLGVRPDGRDVGAATTLTGWTPNLTLAEKDQLLVHWDTVSKHLVHFSHARTRPVNAEEAEVRQLATDVLAVWDQFATASKHGLVPLAADNRIC